MKRFGVNATTVGFLAAVAMLVITAMLTSTGMNRLLQSGQWVEHSEDVLRAQAELFVALHDAEDSARESVASGDASESAHYGAAAAAVRARLRALQDLTTDSPQQRERLRALAPLVSARLLGLDESAALRRSGETATARQPELAVTGKELAAKIRSLLREVQDDEIARLQRRRSEVATSIWHIRLIRAVAASVSLALLFAVFWLLRTEIAERQETEQRLHETSAFLDSVIDNIPNMVFVKHATNLTFARVNRAGEALLGYTRAELIGRSDHDLFPTAEADAFRESDRAVLDAKQLVDIPEEEIHTRDQGERILHTKKVPILDRLGRPTHLLGISEDITERKQDQEQIERLNRELVRRASESEAANKELEAFSYSVSHDLRAPLRHMDGFVTLLRKREHERLDATSNRYLDVIAHAAAKMGRLIDDLLAFSRTGRAALQLQRVALDDLVQEARQELAPATQGRRISWQIQPLPAVEGDPGLLRLVFVNLLSNAIKYSAPRAAADIEIGPAPEPNGHVTIFVRDNGVGFDPQYAHKLFGVFQRLHRDEDFEGTGIGLATVRRIIHRHGGRVWAGGEVDRGATFWFSLRAA